MTTLTDFSELKDKHRRVWASGDYAQSMRYIGPVGPDLVRRLEIGAGDRVLDVATGTGLAAIPAAQAGATVTGLDLTPELLDGGRRRAEAEGLEVEWVQGDAEGMPFEDESFDCVMSSFGVQFAPRHGHSAAELARVCAAGGTLGLCSWTPASFIGRILKNVGAFMPAPPSGASPPPAWGDRAHVEALLGDAFELTFDDAAADFTGESAAGFVDSFASWYGPLISARTTLQSQGRWEELRARLIELAGAFHAGGDGLRAPSSYLVVIGRRR